MAARLVILAMLFLIQSTRAARVKVAGDPSEKVTSEQETNVQPPAVHRSESITRRIAEAVKICEPLTLNACFDLEKQTGYCMTYCLAKHGGIGSGYNSYLDEDDCKERCGGDVSNASKAEKNAKSNRWCDHAYKHMWETPPLEVDHDNGETVKEAFQARLLHLESAGKLPELEAMMREHILKCVCVNRAADEEAAKTCYQGSMGIKKGTLWCEWGGTMKRTTPSWKKIISQYKESFKEDPPVFDKSVCDGAKSLEAVQDSDNFANPRSPALAWLAGLVYLTSAWPVLAMVGY